MTIDGFGADGDSAHESVKEHKKRLFSGLKTPENCYKPTKTKPPNRFGTKMAQVRFLSLRPNKSDNFDTIGIETIRLILFLKMLMAQGFSAPVPF